MVWECRCFEDIFTKESIKNNSIVHSQNPGESPDCYQQRTNSRRTQHNIVSNMVFFLATILTLGIKKYIRLRQKKCVGWSGHLYEKVTFTTVQDYLPTYLITC